jgi:hypothetical protein
MLQNELNAAFDNGERILASGLPFEQPKKPLAQDELHRLNRFFEFAKAKCCRACPAKPSTVAAFIVHEKAEGTPAQQILSLVEAIAAFHDHHGLANPVATATVRQALEEVIHVDPPRSWPREARAEFALLPPDIRDVIARRESERDAWFRRQQNKVAEERKALANGADKSAGNVETKGTASEEIQRRQCEARPGS